MRCILIENARRKSRWKRGGRLERAELEGMELAADTSPDTLLVMHEALERLAAEDAPKAERVKLPFFIGLTKAGETEPSLAAFAAHGEGLSSVFSESWSDLILFASGWRYSK